ncbi:hypothetical protein [Bacillus altitudinis]|uniref:hypothetical protein n=1 Tax=Bacillus altitudinis TaxID=293387 RepID=UPI003B51ED9A
MREGGKGKIAEEGVDVEYGGRRLRRGIEKDVEDGVCEELVKGNIEKGEDMVLDVEDGEIVVKARGGRK